ncbi:hypothetical protein [Gordonia sp. (in: high G+C Gram-positive bacteria)]|uniref:hypothetical protein n=1 Tax=Gordonia sp. (in: high G+C Gram-positive bacteria) TaxID=84139 RepID=UPI003C7570F4
MTGTDRANQQARAAVPALVEDQEGNDVNTTLEQPLLETVHEGAGPLVGIPTDLADVDAQIHAELDFLTSLIWSPTTEAAVHAIVGDHRLRADTHGNPVDRIPLTHPLFLSPSHAAIFRAVTELVDEGTPVTPQILSARLGAADRALRPVLLEVAAPSGHGPLPGGADVPHLARALIDAYYRRGYIALVARMQHAIDEADTDDLAAHWATLTEHQQAAERRRFAVTDALAKL